MSDLGFRLALYAALIIGGLVFVVFAAVVAALPWLLYPVAVIAYVIDKVRRVRSGEPWLTGS